VRVTVVATGLNRSAAVRQPLRQGMKDEGGKSSRKSPPPMVLRTGTGNEVVDYAQPQPRGNARAEPEAESDPGMNYLDIPAFLRRQAD